MSIFAIGIPLFIGLILILVVTSLISRSRNTPGSHHPHHGNFIHHDTYLGYPGEATAKDQSGGIWGSRDMSDDHHDFGDSVDLGGGDAGGGSDSGGGGGGE
jgi:hypothetical protein